jgi:hypothetical protein
MTKRVTISVPDDVAEKARRAVVAGRADSVSSYFVGLAEREPDWAAAVEILDEMLAEAGGATPQDEAWARSVLDLDADLDVDADHQRRSA